MKKILLVMLLFVITSSAYSQFKYSRSGTIKDSSGIAVFNQPIKSWATNYITKTDINENIAGDGLSYDISSGLNINVGVGLKLSDDTLLIVNELIDTTRLMYLSKNQTVTGNIIFSQSTVFSSTSFFANIETNNILTGTGYVNSGGYVQGDNIYSVAGIYIGDNSGSPIEVIDENTNLNVNYITSTTDFYALKFSNSIGISTGFSGTGWTPSGEDYWGTDNAIMGSPDKWLPILINGVDYYIPAYLLP